MKIEIIKCSNPDWWYSNLVGKTREVEDKVYRKKDYVDKKYGGDNAMFRIKTEDARIIAD